MVQPGLAESWQITDDGRTYTFNLRTDVKWHNGETFSSADVKATLIRYCRLRNKGVKMRVQVFLNLIIFKATEFR